MLTINLSFLVGLIIEQEHLKGLATDGCTRYVTRFAKTRHNDAFLEIQIFASINSIYLKLCSVVISMLYCKYFSNYKAR